MRRLTAWLLLFTLTCCSGTPGAPQVALSKSAVTPATFPLSLSADARTLVDATGAPFPILGRTSWTIASLNQADYQSYFADTVARGFNAIECFVPAHHPSSFNPPFNGAGAAPFLKRLDGGNWSGALTYSNISVEGPDFTTPNEAYWSTIDSIVSYAEAQGILVMMFPAYVGFGGGDQGWMQEMVANGQSRMQTYGAWIAARYAAANNIVWMIGGDKGSFDTAQTAAEQGLIDGLHTGPTRFCSAEWDSNMIGKDQSTFAPSITLNSVYSFDGHVSDNGRRAYAYAPTLPAFLLEEPYDEEGPDGTSFNSAATQPVRRFEWWGWLTTIGGYMAGNGYVWPFQPSVWQQHLNTQNAQDLSRLNAFVRSIGWQKLVPSGLAGAKTLVTAGGSTPGAADYVAAAVGSDGKILVAYVPPAHSGNVTIDMSAMSGTTRARWFNPTTAGFTDASGGFTLANSGTHAFTPLGNNGTGFTDWALVLDATTPCSSNAAPTVATPASATPNPVTTATAAVSVLGADDDVEANLTYTWSATGPAGVAFQPNGSNAAKNSTATFTHTGSYSLQVIIADLNGAIVMSSVSVSVVSTPNAIVVAPASATVGPNGTQQFTATEVDQFGTPESTQPGFAWSVSGGGSVNSSGLFTAGATLGGPFMVSAMANSFTGNAAVTVANQPFTIGETTVLGADDNDNANLLIGQPVTLAQNGTIQSLSFYASVVAGKLRLGIYSDSSGSPGTLKASCAEIAAPVVGWNTCNVTAPVALTPGTYWLTYLPSAAGLHFRKGGTSPLSKYRSFAYGPMPSSFGGGLSTTGSHWSFYATLTP